MNEFVRKFESAEQPWSPEEFEARLRAVGPERYHDKHEFQFGIECIRPYRATIGGSQSVPIMVII